MQYRFAIGSSHGPTSCTWKLWNNKNDIYLVQRNSGDSQKFSFHQSGICRWALLKPPASGRDRAILKWTRDDISKLVPGNGSLLAKLAFPSNHLSTKYPDDKSRVQWISPAAPGLATGIEIFLTRESKDVVKEHFQKGGLRSLEFCGRLPNNHFVGVSSFKFDCGRVELNMPGEPLKPGQIFGDLAFPDTDVEDTGRPIRMLMASEGEIPPLFWELGGHKGLLPQQLGHV
jgi:hypothetical protein